MRWLDRLQHPEEINGGGTCPTYLYRWTLLSTPWFKLYLHKFVADDWAGDLHDHPKRFWSIGLRGSYTETYEHAPGNRVCRVWRAPWFRTFLATHKHRLTIEPGKTCWTLVAVGRPARQWGFWVGARWVPWYEYVGSARAEANKACQ